MLSFLKKVISVCACIGLIAISALSQAGDVHPARISRLVIFGDSYSDNGNTYRLTRHLLPLSPPYYKGHFTDGPMWNAYLIDLLEKAQKNKIRLTNYAFGSGMVLKNNVVTVKTEKGPETFHIPDLSQEVFLYTLDPSHALDETLFVLYMGSVDLALMPEGVDENGFAQEVLSTVVAQIHRLVEEGAKHIVVFNIHDFTRSPVWVTRANTYAQKHPDVTADSYLSTRRTLIQQYNAALQKAVQAIPQVRYFDIHAVFDEVFDTAVAEKNKEHITHLAKPCLNADSNTVCKNPENYLFFDAVHPSAAFEKIVAERLSLFLKNKNKPPLRNLLVER